MYKAPRAVLCGVRYTRTCCYYYDKLLMFADFMSHYSIAHMPIYGKVNNTFAALFCYILYHLELL